MLIIIHLYFKFVSFITILIHVSILWHCPLLNGHQAMRMFVPRQRTKQDHRLFLSVLSLEIKWSEGAGIQLTGLTPPSFYVCSKPGHGFPLSFIVVFLVFNCHFLKRDVIVGFVDIGGFFFSTLFKLFFFIMYHMLNRYKFVYSNMTSFKRKKMGPNPW